MDWITLGKSIASNGLPLIGGALGGPAGASIGSLVASWIGLNSDATPEQISQKLLDPASMVRLKELEIQRFELFMRYRIAQDEQDTIRQQNINLTMRGEQTAGDPWIRRWRPFIGFVVGIVFGVVGLQLAAAIFLALFIGRTDILSLLPQVITAMVGFFGPPLAVLGIGFWHRGMLHRIEAGERRNNI